MRETVRSVRIYFVVAGLLAAYQSVRDLPGAPALFVLLDAVDLFVSAGFVYIGFVLPGLLTTTVRPVNVLLALAGGLNLVSVALAIDRGAHPSALIAAVVGTLICLYLYANVKRLASEAQAQRAPWR